jgi:peptidoglycan/LPS O-acetylase OafA/YrhL
VAPVTKYGFLGVNLFFIISGFVILMTAQHGCLRRFLVSRVTRLYPAFWACCTLTAVVVGLADDPRFIVDFSQWLINMTMMSGFVGVSSVDGVYWSLFVELKFYLLVLVLIYFGQIGHVEKYLWLWLAAALLLWLRPLPFFYTLLIPQYAPYFIAGSAFYLVFREGWSASKLLLVILSYASSVLMVHDEWTRTQAYYAGVSFDFNIIAGAVTSFFIIFLLLATGKTRRFSHPAFVYFGALTYPLYLIHQNAGYILLNKFAGGGQPPILLLIEVIVFMMLIAYLVHRVMERRYAKPLGLLLERWFARVSRHSAGVDKA